MDILQFLKANISFNIRLEELKAFTNELKNTSTLREFTGYAALTDLRGFFSEHSKNNDKRKTVWGILIFNIFFVFCFRGVHLRNTSCIFLATPILDADIYM